jgi:hypothetical protein
MLDTSYSNNMLGFLPKVGSGRLITTNWEICAKTRFAITRRAVQSTLTASTAVNPLHARSVLILSDHRNIITPNEQPAPTPPALANPRSLLVLHDAVGCLAEVKSPRACYHRRSATFGKGVIPGSGRAAFIGNLRSSPLACYVCREAVLDPS